MRRSGRRYKENISIDATRSNPRLDTRRMSLDLKKFAPRPTALALSRGRPGKGMPVSARRRPYNFLISETAIRYGAIAAADANLTNMKIGPRRGGRRAAEKFESPSKNVQRRRCAFSRFARRIWFPTVASGFRRRDRRHVRRLGGDPRLTSKRDAQEVSACSTTARMRYNELQEPVKQRPFVE